MLIRELCAQVSRILCPLAMLSTVTWYRYLSPVVILGIITLTRWKSRPSSPPVAPLLSEANLQLTISDFSTIFTLLPVVPNLPSTSSVILLRVCAFSYPPYLILTYFVRLRIILALSGQSSCHGERLGCACSALTSGKALGFAGPCTEHGPISLAYHFLPAPSYWRSLHNPRGVL